MKFITAAQGSLLGQVFNTSAPGGIIPRSTGPGSVAYITNFNFTGLGPGTGLWLPVFTDPSLITMTFDPTNGAVAFTALAPRSNNVQLTPCGLKSVFRLFPDDTGALYLRIKFDNIAYNASGSVSTVYGAGFMLSGSTMAGTQPWSIFTHGIQNATDHTWVMAGRCDSTDPLIQPFRPQQVMTDIGAKVTTEWQFRTKFIFNAANNTIELSNYDYWFGGVWNAFALGANRWVLGQQTFNGFGVYVGLFPRTKEVITVRLREFEIMNGYAAIGSGDRF